MDRSEVFSISLWPLMMMLGKGYTFIFGMALHFRYNSSGYCMVVAWVGLVPQRQGNHRLTLPLLLCGGTVILCMGYLGHDDGS